MKVSYKFASRYIFTYRSYHFINFITFFSILGIIIGSAALICVMSIFNGFREFAEQQLTSFDPHVRITNNKKNYLENPDSLKNILQADKRIKAISGIIKGKALIFKNNNMQAAYLNAVRQNENDSVSGVAKKMIIGDFRLKSYYGSSRIALGAILADKLRALPGDTILLLSPQSLETSLISYKTPYFAIVVVCGLFQSNDQQYDENYAYIPLETGAKLFKIPENSASSLDIRLNSLDLTNDFINDWQKILGNNFKIESWYDLHKDLYNIMQFERLATFVVLSLIIIIAAFNILASLTMTVIEKTNDIALLKAIGATNNLISRIFRNTGLIVGVISSTFGTLLGVGLCYGQIYFKWFRLDTTKYLVDSIPVSLHFIDAAAVFLFSLLLSYLTTIYPSSRVSKVNISEALREY